MPPTLLELHALRRCTSADDLGKLLGDERLDLLTKIELLSTILPFNDRKLKIGKKDTTLKELGRQYYRDLLLGKPDAPGEAQAYLRKQLAQMRALGLDASPLTGLMQLPPYTVVLEFVFQLAQPFLSRDDDALYIIDNPVRKDKVFGAPFMAATSWKGSLRYAATRVALEGLKDHKDLRAPQHLAALTDLLWPVRIQHLRLFGNENDAAAKFFDWQVAEWLLPPLDENQPHTEDEQRKHAEQLRDLAERVGAHFTAQVQADGYLEENVEGRRGRLDFFPTFFDAIGVEVINPHGRDCNVGTQPIYIECVPKQTQARFSLLYTPFDYPGLAENNPTPDAATLAAQMRADLPFLADGIRALFNVFGFGAKTSSGYGIAATKVEGAKVAGRGLNQPVVRNFATLDELPDAAAGLVTALVKDLTGKESGA